LLDDKESKVTSAERDGIITVDDEQEDEDEHSLFYDKAKSFFDNISCEATERAKGLVTTLYSVKFPLLVILSGVLVVAGMSVFPD
jgi:hypothetical protein